MNTHNRIQIIKHKLQLLGNEILGDNGFGIAYKNNTKGIKLITLYKGQIIYHKQEFDSVKFFHKFIVAVDNTMKNWIYSDTQKDELIKPLVFGRIGFYNCNRMTTSMCSDTLDFEILIMFWNIENIVFYTSNNKIAKLKDMVKSYNLMESYHIKEWKYSKEDETFTVYMINVGSVIQKHLTIKITKDLEVISEEAGSELIIK